MKLVEFVKLAIRPRKRKNKQLLLAIAKRLRSLKHEEHYDQDIWIKQTDCGTACCIAGWTVIEAGLTPKQAVRLDRGISVDGNDYLDVEDVARDLLGLKFSEGLNLFEMRGMGWPPPFAERFANAVHGRSEERPSRVAADLLEAIARGKVWPC